MVERYLSCKDDIGKLSHLQKLYANFKVLLICKIITYLNGIALYLPYFIEKSEILLTSHVFR